MNQRKAGALLSYISMFLGYGISIIYTPYMLRKLGMSEYGLYTLVASTINYLSLLSLGLGASYMRIYSKYSIKKENKKIEELNGMYLTIFSLISVITVIIGVYLSSKAGILFGSKLTSDEIEIARNLMLILTLNIALTFPKSVFTTYIQANERFIFFKLLQMFSTVMTPILVVVVLLIGYKSKGLVLITLIMQILTFLGSVVYCKKNINIKIRFNNFDFKLMKEIFIFSSFIFLNMIIDQINWNIDKIILGRFWGTSAVGIYGIASQLNIYYLSISTTISSVFIPKVNKLVAEGHNNKELTEIFVKIGRIQFSIMMLILSGLYIFGKSFIKMWAGVEYVSAYYILLIIITPVTIPLIQNIGNEIQRAKNKHKFKSKMYLVISIVNLSMSIPLAKHYGGIGAAIGTGLAFFIGSGIIMNIYYHKYLQLDIIYFWKEMSLLFSSLIVPLLFGVYVYIKIDLDILSNFIIFGLIYTAIYSVFIYIFGLNDYEKSLIIKLIKRK
ncbi:oligosaccharide flippase family protein [Psychrilyobacter sp.]|uniref:oligosaccharide flippase family protein n=1 Tax=Psychrilyobacter sp. TaxID=2586924 RepID=UPI00301ABB8B